MTIDKKLIDDAEVGLHGIVFRNSYSGTWHPVYQDWVDLKEYVEPVLALIAAARKESEP